MKTVYVLPLRWALPVAELIVCAMALAPFSSFIEWQLRSAIHEYSPGKTQESDRAPGQVISLPDVDISKEVTPTFSEERIAIPVVLNLPCALLGLLRREVVPRGMLQTFWQALTFPIVGVIFWWMAGRSLEALMAVKTHLSLPRISILEVIVSSLVIGLGMLLCVGPIVDVSMREESVYPWKLMLVGAVMWTLLATCTVAARIMQWRMRLRTVHSE